MNQKEMIEICASYGYDFSIPLIYRYGKREGFLIKVKETGRERYTVDEKKFYEWLGRGNIDKSLISIKEACKIHKMAYSEMLYLLNKNKCEYTKMGIEQNGLFYAKRTDIKRIIQQYNRRPKKEN